MKKKWTEQSGEWFQVFASCTFTFRQYNREPTEFDLFKKTSERLIMDVCIAHPLDWIAQFYPEKD